MIRSTKPGFFIFLFFILSSFQMFGQKEMTEENRYVDYFDAVSVSGGIDLFITSGKQHAVTVKARSEVMDDIVTELDGDKLVVKMKKGKRWTWNWKDQNAIEVHITTPEIKMIKASGGSDVHGTNTISGSSMVIESSGGSDLKLDLDVNELICHTSGGSDAHLSGEVENAEIRASGGSDVHARELDVNDCIIDANGGSDTRITVNGELSIEASGASDVFIYGSPEIISRSSSGASDIHIKS